jgi:cytochrome c-type biogenesis protein CcmE
MAVVVLVVGISYAAFPFFSHQGNDPLSVSDLKLQAETLQNQQVSLEGRVASGSVDWDEEAGTIRFVLTDDRERLGITYEGIVPDNFKPGADLEMQGSYRPDGVFEARSFGRPNSFCTFCH